MRQRVCIAMALMPGPDLLIADEPTTALDATLEVQVIHLLKALQADIGCSIVFVSHHLGAVAELCDSVAIMYAGEIVEYGSVRQIFHDPRHPYTRKLIECDPGRIAGSTRSLPTIPGRSSKPDRGAAGLHLSRPLSRPDRALRERAAGDARAATGSISPPATGRSAIAAA